MKDIVADIVAFVIFCVGFVAALELVLGVGQRLAEKVAGKADPTATTATGLAQRADDLERRPSKTREALIGLLTVAMALAAFIYFPPHKGFHAGLGAGAIVGAANLVARAILRDLP